MKYKRETLFFLPTTINVIRFNRKKKREGKNELFIKYFKTEREEKHLSCVMRLCSMFHLMLNFEACR